MNIYEIKEMANAPERFLESSNWDFVIFHFLIPAGIILALFLLYKLTRGAGCLLLFFIVIIVGPTNIMNALYNTAIDTYDNTPAKFKSKDPTGARITLENDTRYITQQEFIDLSTEELSTFEPVDFSYFIEKKQEINAFGDINEYPKDYNAPNYIKSVILGKPEGDKRRVKIVYDSGGNYRVVEMTDLEINLVMRSRRGIEIVGNHLKIDMSSKLHK